MHYISICFSKESENLANGEIHIFKVDFIHVHLFTYSIQNTVTTGHLVRSSDRGKAWPDDLKVKLQR